MYYQPYQYPYQERQYSPYTQGNQGNFVNYNQPQNAQPVSNVTWVPVSGIQGARDHIVQPGNTAWLMDNNDTVFYVKASDALGVTTLKAYRFSEVGLDAPAEPQYVTREEFEALKKSIEEGKHEPIA